VNPGRCEKACRRRRDGVLVFAKEYYKELESPGITELDKMPMSGKEEMERLHGRAEVVDRQAASRTDGTVEPKLRRTLHPFGNLVETLAK